MNTMRFANEFGHCLPDAFNIGANTANCLGLAQAWSPHIKPHSEDDKLPICREMVRSERASSNCSADVNTPDLDEIFNELERWHDILKDHDKSFLRGPRP